jgi:hypothetical protein
LFTKQVRANIYETHTKLFARKNNVEWIPPTKEAMGVHVKQTAYHAQGQEFTPCTSAALGNQLGMDQKSGGIV